MNDLEAVVKQELFTRNENEQYETIIYIDNVITDKYGEWIIFIVYIFFVYIYLNYNSSVQIQFNHSGLCMCVYTINIDLQESKTLFSIL